MELVDIAQQYGPLVAAVVFFLWRDWKREDRLTTRIEKLEDEQREVILPLVEKATNVIAHNTGVMERLERSLDSLKVNSDASKPQP